MTTLFLAVLAPTAAAEASAEEEEEGRDCDVVVIGLYPSPWFWIQPECLDPPLPPEFG